jgi:hypothetical protein
MADCRLNHDISPLKEGRMKKISYLTFHIKRNLFSFNLPSLVHNLS